jgi:hypothetical protein
VNRKLFLKAIQSRAARSAIGASAVRGRGNTGVAPAARAFLAPLDLRAFGTDSPSQFARKLDRTTECLRAALPRPARHWGLARKLLNIFLRDCFYTAYLNTACHLNSAKNFYELPLDSITATRLKRAAGRGALPVWPRVRHLTPKVSAEFQRFAAELARREGIARVHLDALYWSVDRDEEEPD